MVTPKGYEMKLKTITLALLTTLFSTSYSDTYNALISKDYNNFKEVVVTEPVLSNSSCKNILDNGNTYSVYCNMTDFGGGWTLVVSQYESNPRQWNEGIQPDYDPSLVTEKSFTLNTTELPEHTESAFTHGNLGFTVHQFFNKTYSTGDIQTKTIQTNLGEGYMINRLINNHYDYSDPENNLTSIPQWNNTLTVDKNGGIAYSYSFSPNNPTINYRGYSWGGNKLSSTVEENAWMVWVR